MFNRVRQLPLKSINQRNGLFAFSFYTTKKDNVRDQVYQDAINIRNDDPNITVEDLINKGFAYLAVDRDLSWSAIECFELAKKRDTTEKYKDEIECGICEASSNKNSDEISYRFIY